MTFDRAQARAFAVRVCDWQSAGPALRAVRYDVFPYPLENVTGVLELLPDHFVFRDFCGTHNITADVEVIPIQKVNEAYDRLLKSDVKYRFAIDMGSLKSERAA